MTEEERALQARNELGKNGNKLPRNTQISSNDNVKYTLHSLDLMTLAPIDVRTCKAEELQVRCAEYFESCMRDEMKPSVAGFALALNMSRSILFDIVNGQRAIPSDNLDVIRRFMGALNALMEDYMQNGKINPVAGIFLMKNNMNYKDSQEFVVNNSVQDEVSTEELIEEANLLLETEPKKANIEKE